MSTRTTGAADTDAADADATGRLSGRHHQERHVRASAVPRHRLRHSCVRLLLRSLLASRVCGQGQAVQDGQLHLIWGGQELQLVQPVRLRPPVSRLLEGRWAKLPGVCGSAEVPALHRVYQRGAQDRAPRAAAATTTTTCATTRAHARRLLRRRENRLQICSWRTLSKHPRVPTRLEAGRHCCAVLRNV